MLATAFFGQTYFAGAPEDADVAHGPVGEDAPQTRRGLSEPRSRAGTSNPSMGKREA